jgi:hypothetical protein
MIPENRGCGEPDGSGEHQKDSRLAGPTPTVRTPDFPASRTPAERDATTPRRVV